MYFRICYIFIKILFYYFPKILLFIWKQTKTAL